MVKNVNKNIWKMNFDSNIYFLNFDKKILIDAGNNDYRNDIENSLQELINPEDVDIVILTHFHYDHIGLVDLFKNAEFYCSKEEYDDYVKNAYHTVLNDELAKKLKNIRFKFLKENDDFHGLKVIRTPGHTNGSICLFLEKDRILFSGDTLFNRGNIGRYDFPTSVPEKYEKSLKKLENIDYDILCPGHDY